MFAVERQYQPRVNSVAFRVALIYKRCTYYQITQKKPISKTIIPKIRTGWWEAVESKPITGAHTIFWRYP